MNWLDKIKRAPDGLARAQGHMSDLMAQIDVLHRESVMEVITAVNPYAAAAFAEAEGVFHKEVAIMDALLLEQARGFATAIWRTAALDTIKAIAARQGGTQADQDRWAMEQIRALMPDALEGKA